MTDQRQADVEEARNLVEQAERDGSVRLPELGEAELYVLGAARQSLVDGQLVRWWENLPAATREAVATRAVEFLADRGLLRPAAQGENAGQGQDLTAQAHPALGIILTARAHPSFLVVCSAGSQSAPFDPRGFGVAEEARGVRVVLVETVTEKTIGPFGHKIDYGLVTPERAGLLFARWAGLPVRPEGLARRRPPRLIDIYRNREGEGLTRVRFTAEKDGAGLLVGREGPVGAGSVPPRAYDEESFAGLLARAMTEEAP